LLIGGYRILGPRRERCYSVVRAEALVGYYLMSATFFAPNATIGNIYNQALAAMAGAERVFQLLDHRTLNSATRPTPVALPPLEGPREFRDLSFGYDPEHLVLHDI
jgi:ATP-binding cassette subfamily B protein